MPLWHLFLCFFCTYSVRRHVVTNLFLDNLHGETLAKLLRLKIYLEVKMLRPQQFTTWGKMHPWYKSHDVRARTS